MRRAILQSDESNLPFPYVAAARIDYKDYTAETLHEFINKHCVEKGKPLVVSNMNTSPGWKDEAFTLDNLKKYRGDIELTYEQGKNKKTVKLGDFVTSLQKRYKLVCGSSDYSGTKTRVQKIYAKDVLCPSAYKTAMTEFLPEYLHPHGSTDLFGSLPDRFKAENLMCYLGQDDTGTPIHRDLCGTMGHNIMTMASPGGFAEWLIIEHQQRDELAAVLAPNSSGNKNLLQRKFLQSKTHKADGQSRTKSSFMESDRAWLEHQEIIRCNLKVQVIVQRPGDLVIVPSRAYHQVRNQGVSIKIAWNRITPQTLAYAFEDQLPLYHIIGRPEIYKCKAIVAFTIRNWNLQLSQLKSCLLSCTDEQSLIEVAKQCPLLKYGSDVFLKDAKTMIDLYLYKVLLPEQLYDSRSEELITDGPGEICTVQCDFCHSDVFHRYYHCDKCDDYDICLDCYAMGRSCKHIDSMVMHQSPEHLGSYIKTYLEFVQTINLLYGTCDITDESHVLKQPPRDKPTNLATTCRRIERYRKHYGKKFNSLKCNHCGRLSTVSKQCGMGFSLLTIFQRGICKHIESNSDQGDALEVYVCTECATNCNGCSPLDKDPESLEGYNLVYYAHPSSDIRNWGGYIDFKINRTCDYPKINYIVYNPIADHSSKENRIPNDTKVKATKSKKIRDTTVDQDSGHKSKKRKTTTSSA